MDETKFYAFLEHPPGHSVLPGQLWSSAHLSPICLISLLIREALRWMTSRLFVVLRFFVYSLYRPSLAARASRVGTVSFPYMESYNILAQDRAPTACSTSDLVYLTSRCPLLLVEDVEVL